MNLEYQRNLRDTLETLHWEELAFQRRVRELNPQDWTLRLSLFSQRGA